MPRKIHHQNQQKFLMPSAYPPAWCVHVPNMTLTRKCTFTKHAPTAKHLMSPATRRDHVRWDHGQQWEHFKSCLLTDAYQRCTKLGKADLCADIERKKRGRPCSMHPRKPSPCLGGVNGCEDVDSSLVPQRPAKRHRPILPLVSTQMNTVPYQQIVPNFTANGIALPVTEPPVAGVREVRPNDLYRTVPTVAYLIPYTTSS